MEKLQYIKNIKACKTIHGSSQVVLENFINNMIHLFQSFYMKDSNNNKNPVVVDWGRITECKINLGAMLDSGDYTYIGPTTLRFLQSFFCLIALNKFNLNFSEENISVFLKTCERFKGLDWDDLIDDLIDAMYILFSSGKIFSETIIKG
jgi:hypothetical protein